MLKHFLFVSVHAIYSFFALYLVQPVSAFLIRMCMNVNGMDEAAVRNRHNIAL